MDKSSKGVSKDTLFAQRFEYHRHLVSQRWQYMATYIILNGLLLAAWEKLGIVSQFKPVFVTAMLLVGCAFLRLVSRCRRRISENAKALNMLMPEPVLETAGRFLSLKGITLWLYLCIFSISLPWIAILYSLSKSFFVISAIVYAAVLFSVICPDAKRSR